MDKVMITYLVIGVVVGFIICLIFMNDISPKARKYAKLKRDLDQAHADLDSQKQMLVKHFSHSAEILDNMAKDFRRLYQHMAENSSKLVSENDKSVIQLDSDSDKKVTQNLSHEKQPKDYSENSSGLFKSEDYKL
ncbi:DUF1043 family protein [Orbaceae bacterium ESL0721]|nr:DUF1043 family protein [Orbaceae bacterium ESL0721]